MPTANRSHRSAVTERSDDERSADDSNDEIELLTLGIREVWKSMSGKGGKHETVGK